MEQLYIFIILIAFIIAILWILMPFAIFGTKDKLQQIIDETKANRIAMEQVIELLKKDKT